MTTTTNTFRLLRELRDGGPATRFELAAALEAKENTLWFTIRALQDAGLIEPCGRRSNGSIVFRLAPPGTRPSPRPFKRSGPPHRERHAPINAK